MQQNKVAHDCEMKGNSFSNFFLTKKLNLQSETGLKTM